MTISLKHAFTNPKADGADTTIVRPVDWNAEHTITMATNKLLGRSTASTGAVEEITLGTNLSFSGTTLNAAAAAGISTTKFSATRYIVPMTTNAATTADTLTQDLLCAIPFPLHSSGTVTRIGTNIQATGSGSLRLGIYNSSGGQPGTLVLDAGTVSTGTTGDKEITISQALTAGPYFFAFLGSSTTGSVRCYSATSVVNVFGTDTSTTHGSWMWRSSVTYGALPADESAQSYTVANGAMPILWLRAV